MKSSEDLRAEFDQAAIKLAKRPPVPPAKLRRYRSMLKALPADCKQALDIGCGLGDLARLLAKRSEYVLAVDLSPEMIRIARERSQAYPNIEYRVEDVRTWEFPKERFDAVTSLTTLHHMPLEAMLAKIATALRPGGALIVFDLFQPVGWQWALATTLQFFRWRLKKLIRPGRRSSKTYAWKHDPNETYMPIADIRTIFERVLPGAKVSVGSGFKGYLATWTKP